MKVTLAEEPELKVEHAPARRDSAPVPVMEREPPCHPSPNESMQLSVWLPAERQTPCVYTALLEYETELVIVPSMLHEISLAYVAVVRVTTASMQGGEGGEKGRGGGGGDSGGDGGGVGGDGEQPALLNMPSLTPTLPAPVHQALDVP